MRPRDRRELNLGWRQSPQQVMADGLAFSVRTLTLLNDLKPLCMCGIVPIHLLSGHYLLWIVPTREIDRHRVVFARASKRYLPQLMAGCRLVTNLIDRQDGAAVRWARWLGCQFRSYDGSGAPARGRFAQFFIEAEEGAWQQAHSSPAA